MQRFCNDIRQNERKQKEVELAATVEELTKSHTMKANKF